MPLILRLPAGLLALAPALHGAAAARRVTIAPAPVERAAMVVTLTLPREFADGAILRDERGQPVPLQAEADLSAKFIVARQAAGQTLRFTLEPGRTPDQGNVQVVEEPSPPRPGAPPGIATAAGAALIQGRTGRLRVSVGGRPILYYQMDKDAVPREDIDPAFRRAGYLHPVLTPSGTEVTEGFSATAAPTGPFSPGITALGPSTARVLRGFDFAITGEAEAPLEFGGVDNIWSGPVHGGYNSWQRWVEDKGAGSAVLVHETWELTAYAIPKPFAPINLFDLVITQTNATAGPLSFGRGLDLRHPATWHGVDRQTRRADGAVDGTPRWITVSGHAGTDDAGVAVLVAPPTAPGAMSFLSTRQASPIPMGVVPAPPLRSGARSTLRQRMVVFDGPPDRALLDALWNGYTVPAVVTVSAP